MIKIKKKSLICEAVAEQLKSQAAEDGLEKGGRGTVAMEQQIVGYRRRTENVFASMIKDEWYSKKELDSKPPIKPGIKKSSNRKRKRGPRSIQAIEKRALKFNSNSRL